MEIGYSWIFFQSTALMVNNISPKAYINLISRSIYHLNLFSTKVIGTNCSVGAPM